MNGKTEQSAGGIVIKKENDEIFILLAKHAKYHEWGFPKGHIGDKKADESKEEAALREVKEETGIEAEILSQGAKEEYVYTLNGEKRQKTVYYYLMRYKSGNFAEKDHEMEDVKWVSLAQVEGILTHKDAKKMFGNLLSEINKLSAGIKDNNHK